MGKKKSDIEAEIFYKNQDIERAVAIHEFYITEERSVRNRIFELRRQMFTPEKEFLTELLKTIEINGEKKWDEVKALRWKVTLLKAELKAEENNLLK